MIKALLALRNKLKSKKPTFTRHDSHKKARVPTSWRRPRGRQNKMRLHTKGYARGRSTGFSSPAAVRGLSREGLTQNNVATLADFTGLDAKTDGVIIARTVGNRRRAELVAHAQKEGFTVLNIDVKAFETKQAALQKEQKAHQKAMSERKKQHEAKKAEKKASKKEDKAEKLSDDEKKTAQKKEQDKILTKGEQ